MSDEGLTLTKACQVNDHSTVTSLIKSQNLKSIINKPVADKLLYDTSDDTLFYTPLTIACEHASLDIVQQLVHAGADVKGANDRIKPLQGACVSTIDRLAKVKYLLSLDSSLVHSRDKYKNTPLTLAAVHGHDDVMSMLVQHGADVNVTGQYDRSPVHGAAQKGHVNVIHRLVELKANVNVRDNLGSLPLHIAAEFGHVKCVTAFVEIYNCDINDRNTFGNTPLHTAAVGGHLNVVQYLTSWRSCDINITDKNGRTAFDLAHDEKHHYIETFLTVTHPLKREMSALKREVSQQYAQMQAQGAAQAMEALAITDDDKQSAQFLASSVRHHMETLTSDLHIGDHLDYLFSKRVLTIDEYERIDGVIGATQQMRRLLVTLIRKKDHSWAPVFLDSLKRNDCSKSSAKMIETTSADDIRDEDIR